LFIGQIIFYAKDGILQTLGYPFYDEDLINEQETFDIGENERLIGCELDYLLD